MLKIFLNFYGVFIFIFLCSDFITGGVDASVAPVGDRDVNEKTLVVTTVLSPPYCKLKDSVEKLSGNEQYEGYAIDLIHEISVMYGFNYTINLSPDGRYGNVDKKTGKWNGMVRELIDERADVAIADLTITYERAKVVDFSMPFMNLGISVLYMKPHRQPPSIFSFLDPFSFEVWLYILTAFLGVSVVLYLLSRFTQDKETSEKKFDQGETPFTLLNCMWFTVASLLQQRCVFLPRTISTRMVAVFWWIFALIMISSYTANLAAYLTTERLETAITSVEDLPRQSSIKYGALKGGSTSAFFKNSPHSTYRRMWSAMESSGPSVFTDSNVEGVERVKAGNGNYAFLMESSTIEYVVERNCDLTQIGGLLDSKGYGIAMRKNSPFRSLISEAILKLREQGKLDTLKMVWWKEKHGGGACSVRVDGVYDSYVMEMDMANVNGVFLLLIIGLVIACIIAGGEYFWKSRKAHASGELEMQQN